MSRGRGYRWLCPYCPARGRENSPDEARDAGVDHYLATHDRHEEETT